MCLLFGIFFSWEADIAAGGTIFEKYEVINDRTIKQFAEARSNLEQVTTRILQQWAMQFAHELGCDQFIASERWAQKFKQKYNIRQRKITRYVAKGEVTSMENILEAANKFQNTVKALYKNYPEDLVLNTDQIGCQYQSTIARTLSIRGVKSVPVKTGNINKITHSYTAQYTLTTSGKLVPRVFVCLQETKNEFGPIVQKRVDSYTKLFKNIVVTCSTSGKLTTYLYKQYLTNVR